MEKKGTDPNVPKKAKMETMATLFNPSYPIHKSEELANDLTEFIVESILPFAIAESPLLRRLIKRNHGKDQMPTCRDVSAKIPKKAGQCIESLRAFVENQQISITLDKFSHKEHSLLCITGAYLSKGFEFQSKVLAVESFLEKHTGDNIANKINSILAELEVEKSNVVAATRDGAPNLAGPKGGGCVKTNTESLHCFCHVLHLVVWDGINSTHIVSTVAEKANKICVGFHRTPTALAAFREVQGEESTTLTLQIKARWNSTLGMLSSILYHKAHLLKYAEKFPGCVMAKYIKSMSEADFDEVTDIVHVLQPFEDCTKMVAFAFVFPMYLTHSGLVLERFYFLLSLLRQQAVRTSGDRLRQICSQYEYEPGKQNKRAFKSIAGELCGASGSTTQLQVIGYVKEKVGIYQEINHQCYVEGWASKIIQEPAQLPTSDLWEEGGADAILKEASETNQENIFDGM